MRILLIILVLASSLSAQTVMNTTETVIDSTLGYWTSSLNTGNPSGGQVFTDTDGTQWICYAAELNTSSSGSAPLINIAHNNHGNVHIWTAVGASFPSADQHESCSIALDVNGYIHLTYGMHILPLNYYRSTAPRDPSTMAKISSMISANSNCEVTEGLTFPTFFSNPATRALYFLFQCGGGAYAQEYAYQYDAGATTWSGLTGAGTYGQLSTNIAPAGTQWFNGLPQWAPNGTLWFTFILAGQRIQTQTCGGTGFACQLAVMGWNGTSFIKFGGAAQTVPLTLANMPFVLTIYPNAVSNTIGAQTPGSQSVGILNGTSIDSGGTIFVPYYKQDANGIIQEYVAESSTGSFVEHQLTSNTVTFSPPITWMNVLQSVTAISSGTCTWVSYADVFNWGGGQAAWKSCDNFHTSQEFYLTSRFNPNGMIYQDQQRNYMDGSISFLFAQVNDPDYRFPTFVNSSTPGIGTLYLITWSPGGSSVSGNTSWSGNSTLQ